MIVVAIRKTTDEPVNINISVGVPCHNSGCIKQIYI
jgi:D-serine deaminase-like pyridoxal phosphate-dependent protein